MLRLHNEKDDGDEDQLIGKEPASNDYRLDNFAANKWVRSGLPI